MEDLISFVPLSPPFCLEEPEQPTQQPLRPGVASFIRSLYDILNAEDPQILRWVHQGQAFAVFNQEALAETILPKYFRHNKYASFQRQLNYFGFKKWSKSRAKICTYSRQYFSRNHPEQLQLIKRKSKAPPICVLPWESSTLKPLSPPFALLCSDVDFFPLDEDDGEQLIEWRHSEPLLNFFHDVGL